MPSCCPWSPPDAVVDSTNAGGVVEVTGVGRSLTRSRSSSGRAVQPAGASVVVRDGEVAFTALSVVATVNARVEGRTVVVLDVVILVVRGEEATLVVVLGVVRLVVVLVVTRGVVLGTALTVVGLDVTVDTAGNGADVDDGTVTSMGEVVNDGASVLFTTSF